MGQRERRQIGIPESVAEPRFEIGESPCPALIVMRRTDRPAGSAPAGPRCHQCTRWKMRSQRTVHGQLQTCHAGVSSAIEKKMISPRPIRFSNGT